MQKIHARKNKIHRDKEYFWIICSKILFIELVSVGSVKGHGGRTQKCVSDSHFERNQSDPGP